MDHVHSQTCPAEILVLSGPWAKLLHVTSLLRIRSTHAWSERNLGFAEGSLKNGKESKCNELGAFP